MPAAYQNLYLEQGTTFDLTIAVDDVYGNTYNLTSASADSQMRKSYYSSNATATFVTSINLSTGSITISLSAAATSNIAPGRYVYDTILTQANTVVRILEGIVDVSPGVTNINNYSPIY
jgi:hypothetical protein